MTQSAVGVFRKLLEELGQEPAQAKRQATTALADKLSADAKAAGLQIKVTYSGAPPGFASEPEYTRFQIERTVDGRVLRASVLFFFRTGELRIGTEPDTAVGGAKLRWDSESVDWVGTDDTAAVEMLAKTLAAEIRAQVANGR